MGGGGGGLWIFSKKKITKGKKKLELCRRTNLLTGQKLYKCKSQGVFPRGAHWLLIQLLYIEVYSLLVNIISPEKRLCYTSLSFLYEQNAGKREIIHAQLKVV